MYKLEIWLLGDRLNKPINSSAVVEKSQNVFNSSRIAGSSSF